MNKKALYVIRAGSGEIKIDNLGKPGAIVDIGSHDMIRYKDIQVMDYPAIQTVGNNDII